MADKDNKKRNDSELAPQFNWASFSLFAVSPLLWTLSRSDRGQRASGAINEAIKDNAVTIVDAAGYAASKGDSHVANSWGNKTWKLWDGVVTQNSGLGQFGFRMAAGWDIPAGMKLNGKVQDNNTPATADAVFVRNKNGDVEVMDHHDSRYYDIALPYVVASVANPIVAGKAFGALRSMSSLSKVPDIVFKTLKMGSYAEGAVVGAATVAEVHHDFTIEALSVRRFSQLFDDPKSLTPDKLRNGLNDLLEKYSYTEGQRKEQFYIKPIESGENPLYRLSEISSGLIHNVSKYKNPYDNSPEILKEKNVQATTREAIRGDAYFKRGFFNLAEKVLAGKPLTESENTLLRFGIPVYFSSDPVPLVDKNNKTFPQDSTVKILRELMDSEGISNSKLHEFSLTAQNDVQNIETMQRKMLGIPDPKQKDPMAVFSL